MRSPLLPYFAFVGCALIWSSTFLAIRVGNDVLPPLWACALRLILAAILLNLILVVTRQPWPKGAALKAAAMYGFLEFGVSLSLLYYGERSVPSGLAALLYSVGPVVAMFAARAMNMEKLTFQRLGAALLALGGVLLVFWGELQSKVSAIGLLSAFLAACAAPIAGLFLQRGPKQSAIGANAVGVLVGVPFALLGSLILGEKITVPTTPTGIYPIVYLAIMSSVVAFGLFAWLINHWKVTTVAFLGVIVPVTAVALGVLFRHESFNTGSLAGGAIVLVGVMIALRSDPAAGRAGKMVGPTIPASLAPEREN